MKNLHVLPTNKAIQLWHGDTKPEHYNIYITDHSEIKVGDWYYLQKVGRIGSPTGAYKCKSKTASTLKIYPGNCKKIILTTNTELIADGVQAIDDEFLEWFVKNPSCEEVKTKLVEFEVDMGLGDSCIEYGSYYKIIIPQEEPKHPKVLSENGNELFFDEQGNLIKEEPKQYTSEELEGFEDFKETIKPKPEEPEISDEAKERAKNYMALKGALEVKEETLEEYIKEVTKNFGNEMSIKFTSGGMKLGAKWQADRMYSEEEVRKIAEEVRWQAIGDPLEFTKNFDKWFEQFKKK
jgi:hypothetical protein